MQIKFLFYSVVFFLFISDALSQVSMNKDAFRFLNELKSINLSQRSMDSDFVSHYDLMSLEDNSQKYIGVAALVDLTSWDSQKLKRMGIKNDTRLNDLWTFRVPVDHFEDFIKLEGLKYIEVAEHVDPFLSIAKIDSRTDSVNNGFNLPRAYTGKDVIIAIIDWGFDYTHPVFYDTTLTQLRLSRAWDQNKLSGPAPDGFSFGTEYVGQDALLQAQQDTLYVFGPGSHGTHVAGIAGGSGAGTPHKGAAPDSELIFISLRRDGPSFVDAINYVSQYAQSVNKPFVVNMSFGSHLGPHDGSSLKNYAMEQLSGPGQIFVGSAGNNGNQQFHLDYDFTKSNEDTLYTVVDFAGGANIFGQTVSIWGSPNSEFEASFRVVDAGNTILGQTPFFSTRDKIALDTTVAVRNVNLRYILDTDYGHYLNDKPSMRWQIRNVSSSVKVVLMVTSKNSHVHMWNCQRHNDRFLNWGRPFKNNFPNAKGGDELYGVGEPAGTGKNVITVASYQPEVVLSNGSLARGTLSSFSSSGPTVDGRVKPDIASTGQEIVSSVNSFDPTYGLSNYVARTTFNGKTYGFVPFSGTSMSGPMVAGIVALMLEANPELTSQDVRRILFETARLDRHTGNLPEEGHLKWGHGKANALAAIRSVIGLTTTHDLVLNNDLFHTFPNPSNSVIWVETTNELESIEEIKLFNLDGQLLLESSQLENQRSIKLDISHLPNGMYLMQCKNRHSMGFSKVIISH